MTARRPFRKTISAKLMPISPELALRICPPTTMSIELTSRCNIRCLCCPVGQGKIESGNMSMADFRSIIGLLPRHIEQIDFSHRGDPTMNRNLSEMVEYAHRCGFKTELYTNGLVLDKHVDALVRSGLTTIRVDLDGASSQSYEQYRIGSDFERVRSGVRRLVEARRESGGRYPEKIYLLCVVSAFNEREVPAIQEMARDLGVDGVLFKSAITNYGSKYYRDRKIQDDIAPVDERFRRPQRSAGFICPFLWRGAILFNGEFIMCTADFEGAYTIGNILEANSYDDVFYGKKARDIRRRIMKGDRGLCRNCAVVSENHYIADISRTFG
jgi:MoaA/NifB/PqqE/SkfB family radical SAM enzyme